MIFSMIIIFDSCKKFQNTIVYVCIFYYNIVIFQAWALDSIGFFYIGMEAGPNNPCNPICTPGHPPSQTIFFWGRALETLTPADPYYDSPFYFFFPECTEFENINSIFFLD